MSDMLARFALSRSTQMVTCSTERESRDCSEAEMLLTLLNANYFTAWWRDFWLYSDAIFSSYICSIIKRFDRLVAGVRRVKM